MVGLTAFVIVASVVPVSALLARFCSAERHLHLQHLVADIDPLDVSLN
jgi:hypothetical protein